MSEPILTEEQIIEEAIEAGVPVGRLDMTLDEFFKKLGIDTAVDTTEVGMENIEEEPHDAVI